MITMTFGMLVYGGNDSLFSLLQQHSVLISMHVKLYEVFMKQHLPQVISKL